MIGGDQGESSLRFTLPLRTKSGNIGHGREHWAARQRRVKQERGDVHLLWPRRQLPEVLRFPVEVLLVRVRPRGKELDDDNLSAALKSVRDQVAAELGVDDGDKTRIRFRYAEERGPWGVRIELKEVSP